MAKVNLDVAQESTCQEILSALNKVEIPALELIEMKKNETTLSVANDALGEINSWCGLLDKEGEGYVSQILLKASSTSNTTTKIGLRVLLDGVTIFERTDFLINKASGSLWVNLGRIAGYEDSIWKCDYTPVESGKSLGSGAVETNSEILPVFREKLVVQMLTSDNTTTGINFSVKYGFK